MFRRLDLLVPGFLKTLDRHLLLNHPRIWATRGHYVLFFGGMGLLLVWLKATFFPVSLQDVPDPEKQALFLVSPVSIGALLWVRSVVAFSGARHPGHFPLGTQVLTQGIYVSGVLLLAAIPWVYGWQLTERVRQLDPQEEVWEDIRLLNQGEAFVPASQDEVRWMQDRGYPQRYFDGYHPLKQNLCTAPDNSGLIEQIRATTKEERHAYIRAYIRSYQRVLHKYSGFEIPYSTDEILHSFESGEWLDLSQLSDAKETAANNIETITSIRYGDSIFSFKNVRPMLLYVALMLGLAMMVFVSVRSRYFIIAGVLGILGIGFSFGLARIAIGYVLLFLSPLVGNPFEQMCSPYSVFVLMNFITSLGYYGLLLLVGYWSRRSQNLQWLRAVALILLTMTAPFVALLAGFWAENAGIFDLTNSDDPYSLGFFLAGTVIYAWVMWNVFFLPRLKRMTFGARRD